MIDEKRPVTIHRENAHLAHLADLSRLLSKSLKGLVSLCARRGLSIDEAMILLALGHLNFTCGGRMPGVTPVHCAEIAVLLRMPRETVRRKLHRLAVRELIEIGKKGAVVLHFAEWEALASQITGHIDRFALAARHN